MRQVPSFSQRRAVVREHPNSAAIRRAPQPSAFSRNIADTSSGSFISSLRRPSVRESVSVVIMVIQTSLSTHRGGQILMSPEGQFVVSPDRGWQAKATASPFAFRPEFQLRDATGRPVTQADFRNQFVLVVFGYTCCPEATPATLSTVSEVLTALGGDADQVQALFISIDPDRDGPSELTDYAAAFHPSILALTGSPVALRATAREFGILHYPSGEPGEPDGYPIEHSTHVVLLGPSGAWRREFDYGTPAAEIVADLSSRL